MCDVWGIELMDSNCNFGLIKFSLSLSLSLFFPLFSRIASCGNDSCVKIWDRESKGENLWNTVILEIDVYFKNMPTVQGIVQAHYLRR